MIPGTEEYTFERFVVGSSNKFAHAAARAVADNPGHSYNPLYIYGESGLGKTHLLYAIANSIHQNKPGLSEFNILGTDPEAVYYTNLTLTTTIEV